MRYFIVAASVIGSFAWTCSRLNAQRPANSQSAPTSAGITGTAYADYIIGDPVTYKNLSIFPISSKTAKNQDRYTTLDEGLAIGTVKVTEVGAERGDINAAAANGANGQVGQSSAQTNQRAQSANQPAAANTEGPANPFGPAEGADVNKLMVQNNSGKPLYLMPGEVISGGEQDRTIGEETVIDSSNKAVPIDVFCVENGRWAGRSLEATTSRLGSAQFNASQSLVVSQSSSIEQLAKDAKSGKFIASVGQLNKDSRIAVQQSGDQSKVWEEVAKTNSKVGNRSESGNFAENYFSRDVAKDLEQFVKKLKPIGETKQIVGVAVAIDGKMHSVDIFESTPLFKKFWSKLLKSYALDAIAANSERKGNKSGTATINDCIVFLKNVENAKTQTVALAKGQQVEKHDSPMGISFSYYNAKSGSHAGGGAFGGGVHTSVLSK